MDILNKMRDLDEFIQISLLSEYYYCKRRCSLIILEGHPGENIYMAEGTVGHEKVHTSKIDKRTGFAKLYNMPLYSQKYNLVGKSDCIECVEHKNGSYVDLLDGKKRFIFIKKPVNEGYR